MGKFRAPAPAPGKTQLRSAPAPAPGPWWNHTKKSELMCAYLLNKSFQYKSNCRFSAKELPLLPGRCRKDFFLSVTNF